MRNFITLFLILVVGLLQAQTVRIADNNPIRPTGANIFATLQEALDAAANGDIVYVTPSATDYSGTINKRITLVGAGFGIAKNGAILSKLNFLGLYSGSNGSIITGLSLNSMSLANDANITIENNNIGTLQGAQGSVGLVIRNNIINAIGQTFGPEQAQIYWNVIKGSFLFQESSTCTINISNNIIYGSIFTGDNLTNSIFIINNVFVASSNNPAFYGGMGKLFARNILYGSILSSPGTNNNFTDNIYYPTLTGVVAPENYPTGNTGTGNKNGVDPLFVNVPLSNTYSETYDFTLKPGSPAKGGASGGADIGLTGGPFPFTDKSISLKPGGIPIVQDVNVTGLVTPGTPVKANAKAKSY